MTASLFHFPSRGSVAQNRFRENAAYETATDAGERMACMIVQDNLARSIIISREGDARRHISVSPAVGLAPRLAAADIVPNLGRALRAWSFPRIQILQEAVRGLCVSFKTFLCVLVHDENSSEGTNLCAPKEFPKTEKQSPRMRCVAVH